MTIVTVGIDLAKKKKTTWSPHSNTDRAHRGWEDLGFTNIKIRIPQKIKSDFSDR
jgi:hypothetical protein